MYFFSKCPVPPTAIISSTDEFLPCFIHQAADASWHYASCCGGAQRQRLDSLRQPPSWSPLSRRSTPGLRMWIPMIPANWAKATIPCPISRKSGAPVRRWNSSTLPTSWCLQPEWRCDLWERESGGRQSWNSIFLCCLAPVCTWKRCISKEELRSKRRLQLVNPKCRTSHLWIAAWHLQHVMRNSRLWQSWSRKDSRIHLQVHGGAGWSFGMQRWPSRSMTVVWTVALSWNEALTSTSGLPSQTFNWKVRVSSWSTSPRTFGWERLRFGAKDATRHSKCWAAGTRFTWQAPLSSDVRLKSRSLCTSFWMSAAPGSFLANRS